FRPFYFSKVRVDPTDNNRVYLLGWGLAISDDAGRHFRAGGAKLPHGDMHAFAIDPADRDHLIMGTDGGVYVSWDRAGTWDFLNHTGPARQGLRAAPGRADRGQPGRPGAPGPGADGTGHRCRGRRGLVAHRTAAPAPRLLRLHGTGDPRSDRAVPRR